MAKIKISKEGMESLKIALVSKLCNLSAISANEMTYEKIEDVITEVLEEFFSIKLNLDNLLDENSKLPFSC
jgi:formiminotetrahydrofolate cyclodeaminase